jgi:hypothetical protein
MGCEVEVRKPLAHLTLVRARSLPRWLQKLPVGAISTGEVLELERLARTPRHLAARLRGRTPASHSPRGAAVTDRGAAATGSGAAVHRCRQPRVHHRPAVEALRQGPPVRER